MKKFLFLAFLVTVPLYVSLYAQTDLQKATQKVDAQKIPVDPDVKVGVLSNGLTYYIKKNEKPADKVELRLVVNAGSVLEEENQLGLAHFTEHMGFNGTKNFEKNDLVDYLQSIGVKFGADLNAYTSFDQTVYILPIPSDDEEKLEKGFQILEDWAHNATLTDEAIEDERGVVLEEYRLGLGPQKRMMQEYLPKLMYGSRYADRLPIGTKEVLDNFEPDVLRKFYKDWYRPDLIAVVAVGDLEIEELEAKIVQHFDGIPKAEDPREREIYNMPNHDETLVAIASDREAPFTQVQIMYKDRFEAPIMKTMKDYRDQIIQNLFSSMINSRLNELRNSNEPPFVFGFSNYGNTFARTKKAYQSFATTSEDGQLKGLKALLEENERVSRYGFQEGEFERAKKRLMARWDKTFKDRDKQESNRLVNEYVNNYLMEEPIPGIPWEYENFKKFLPTIRLSEVNGLIKQYIHDDNRVIILTGPEKEGLTLVTEEEVLSLLQETKNAEILPYEDAIVRENLVEDLLPAGSVLSSDTNEAIGTTTLTLSNGAKVTYKKTDFKNDEVLFSAFSYGGMNLYSDEDYKSTVFANRGVADAGIGGLKLNEMNKLMSGKIASVRPGIYIVTEGFNGQAAPKDLEILFQMVYLYFTDVNKDEEAFQSFIAKEKSFLGNLMSNPQFYFSDKIGKARNEGNTRYVGFPTIEKLENSDYDRAYEIHKERFSDAGDFHFYFVGNIDEKAIEEYASKYLASLPAKNSDEKIIPTKFREKDEYRKVVIKKGKDPKSQVNIIWREDDIEYSDKEKLIVDALGEILTIKLIEKLREEEGGVYGVGARGLFRKLSFPGVDFSISFPCGPENVDRLIEVALAEVQKIKDEGPTDKDLSKVKESYLLKYKENMKRNRFWMNTLRTSGEEGSNPAKVLKTVEAVNSLSKEDIQRAARIYLDENYFLGVLMPEDN